MSKRIIAVNAGPRKGWNTDTLIMEAAKGAESVGAEVQKFDLFRLEKYTGCISCFGCKREKPCCNEHPIPVLLIMTSNAPDNMYMDLMKNYQQVLSRFVGPTEIFVSGDTLRLKDYGKTDWPWTLFNPASKQQRHETVFPAHCKRAFEMGAALAK